MKLVDNQTLNQFVNELSVKHFGKLFIGKARFNHRLRTTGGRYLPIERIIEINPKYALEMEEELEGIIKHELCHYHLHIEGKGYRHGDLDFKNLLKKTDSPRHCKPLPSEINNFKYLYKCKKCNSVYKRKRVVNLKKYRCGKCKGELTLI